jgi:hypothetical protein
MKETRDDGNTLTKVHVVLDNDFTNPVGDEDEN